MSETQKSNRKEVTTKLSFFKLCWLSSSLILSSSISFNTEAAVIVEPVGVAGFIVANIDEVDPTLYKNVCRECPKKKAKQDALRKELRRDFYKKYGELGIWTTKFDAVSEGVQLLEDREYTNREKLEEFIKTLKSAVKYLQTVTAPEATTLPLQKLPKKFETIILKGLLNGTFTDKELLVFNWVLDHEMRFKSVYGKEKVKIANNKIKLELLKRSLPTTSSEEDLPLHFIFEALKWEKSEAITEHYAPIDFNGLGQLITALEMKAASLKKKTFNLKEEIENYPRETFLSFDSAIKALTNRLHQEDRMAPFNTAISLQGMRNGWISFQKFFRNHGKNTRKQWGQGWKKLMDTDFSTMLQEQMGMEPELDQIGKAPNPDQEGEKRKWDKITEAERMKLESIKIEEVDEEELLAEQKVKAKFLNDSLLAEAYNIGLETFQQLTETGRWKITKLDDGKLLVTEINTFVEWHIKNPFDKYAIYVRKKHKKQFQDEEKVEVIVAPQRFQYKLKNARDFKMIGLTNEPAVGYLVAKWIASRSGNLASLEEISKKFDQFLGQAQKKTEKFKSDSIYMIEVQTGSTDENLEPTEIGSSFFASDTLAGMKYQLGDMEMIFHPLDQKPNFVMKNRKWRIVIDPKTGEEFIDPETGYPIYEEIAPELVEGKYNFTNKEGQDYINITIAGRKLFCKFLPDKTGRISHTKIQCSFNDFIGQGIEQTPGITDLSEPEKKQYYLSHKIYKMGAGGKSELIDSQVDQREWLSRIFEAKSADRKSDYNHQKTDLVSQEKVRLKINNLKNKNYSKIGSPLTLDDRIKRLRRMHPEIAIETMDQIFADYADLAKQGKVDEDEFIAKQQARFQEIHSEFLSEVAEVARRKEEGKYRVADASTFEEKLDALDSLAWDEGIWNLSDEVPTTVMVWGRVYEMSIPGYGNFKMKVGATPTPAEQEIITGKFKKYGAYGIPAGVAAISADESDQSGGTKERFWVFITKRGAPKRKIAFMHIATGYVFEYDVMDLGSTLINVLTKDVMNSDFDSKDKTFELDPTYAGYLFVDDDPDRGWGGGGGSHDPDDDPWDGGHDGGIEKEDGVPEKGLVLSGTGEKEMGAGQ